MQQLLFFEAAADVTGVDHLEAILTRRRDYLEREYAAAGDMLAGKTRRRTPGGYLHTYAALRARVNDLAERREEVAYVLALIAGWRRNAAAATAGT